MARTAGRSSWVAGRTRGSARVIGLLAIKDALLRAEMRLELVRLHRKLGRTTIHVTHDQVEAMTMGDRIFIMKDGRLIQQGPPLEVYANPADTFVAGFLASPPMNLVSGRLVEVGDGLAFRTDGAMPRPMAIALPRLRSRSKPWRLWDLKTS